VTIEQLPAGLERDHGSDAKNEGRRAEDDFLRGRAPAAHRYLIRAWIAYNRAHGKQRRISGGCL
jgi:hypothetical protein